MTRRQYGTALPGLHSVAGIHEGQPASAEPLATPACPRIWPGAISPPIPDGLLDLSGSRHKCFLKTSSAVPEKRLTGLSKGSGEGAGYCQSHTALLCPSTATSGLHDSGKVLTLSASRVPSSIKRFALSHDHSSCPLDQVCHTPWSSLSLPYTYFMEILYKTNK